MNNTKDKFIEITNSYNIYCKAKYQRQLWRDFSPQEIAQYPVLRESVLEWALQEDNFSTTDILDIRSSLEILYGENPKPIRELGILEKDVDAVAGILASGKLVVIPNGKIYVIFGMEPHNKVFDAARKINSDKLRHLSMPIVRLAFSKSTFEHRVKNAGIKKFLTALIEHFRPIGLLLPEEDLTAKSMYVFYKDLFFEELSSTLQAGQNSTVDILVSSANITTTGANTTAKGVVHDFCYSDFIWGVVDEGDLKLKADSNNNSTTIIECAPDGELSYYRIGYPSQHELDDFARHHGVQIAALPTSRKSKAR